MFKPKQNQSFDFKIHFFDLKKKLWDELPLTESAYKSLFFINIQALLKFF
jgi:hypothetical protein